MNLKAFNKLILLITIVTVLLTSGCGSSTPAPTTAPTKAPTPQPTATQPVVTLEQALSQKPGAVAPVVTNLNDLSLSEVPVNGPLQITFDQPMDQASTAAALHITGSNGAVSQGKFAWPDARTLSFIPDEPFKSGATYQAVLSAKAASAQKVSLGSDVSFSFNTTSELRVSQTFPADGAVDVTNNAVITAMFNRPVVALMTAEEQVKLESPISISPEASGHGEWLNTSVYVFHPDKPYTNGTTYTVTVKAGLKDASGETSLGSDFSWKFTTVQPTVAYLRMGNYENPENGAVNVPLNATFTIGFRQPMNQDRVYSAFSLAGVDGVRLPFIIRWNKALTEATVTPQNWLHLQSNYSLKVANTAQAAGGGTLKDGLDWHFSTVNRPAIVYAGLANGIKSGNYAFQIKFASPMDLRSVTSRVIFTPKLENNKNYWFNGQEITYYGLKPSTKYSVQLIKGMSDPYGNMVNVTQTIAIETSAYPAQASLMTPPVAMIRVGGPQEFYTRMLNASSIDLSLYRLTKERFATIANNGFGNNFTPAAQDLVWKHQETNTAKLDQEALNKISLAGADGKPLPAGFYALVLDSKDIPHPKSPFLDTSLIVVASANLTYKDSQQEALLWLTDLTSGKPLAGVPMTVYDQNFSVLGKGSSDKDGLLHLDLPKPTSDDYGTRYAIAEDGQTFAFASGFWGSGVSPSDFGIWDQFYHPLDPNTAYLYTDRPLYRPGQPVDFKGIARSDDDLTYSLPSQKEVEVTIDSYKETVDTQRLSLNDFGSFSGTFKLSSDAALGAYTITARFPGNDHILGQISFNVAEYRKPEFLVDVTAEPANLLQAEKFKTTVAASYYSGGSLVGAQVDWTLRGNTYNFSPPDKFGGYNFYDFSSASGYTSTAGGQNKVIAEGHGLTDEKGQFILTLPSGLTSTSASQTLTLEATVTDLTGYSVSGRATLTAHHSTVYPGIRPENYVIPAGQETSFKLAALDWSYAPVAGQPLSVDVYQHQWYSVQQQDAQGNLRWVSSVKETLVASFKNIKTDKDGLATVKFTPAKGGAYRARVTAVDPHGNLARASAYLWVAGKDYVPWEQTNDRSFQIIADQNSYKTGDTAELLIASPFQGESYALLTIERGRIRHQEVLLLNNNSTVYKLPVTADMAPNVYVSVVVVKGVDATNPRPNFKLGMLRINVATDQQALKVEVSPDKTQAGPGDQVTYTVHTTDLKGQPVKAEVSLGLSDLATLSLSDPNSAPILDFFYSQRNLGVRTSLAITRSIEDYNATITPTPPEGQRMGSGGGKGGGYMGVFEIRENFPDTALWQAQLQTSADGTATATVTLPDNLTTWRMDARAITLDTRAGQTTNDMVSTKPLLVRPQTPRFFVASDKARLGAAVHNNTTQDMVVDVALEGEGITLNSPASQKVTIAAKQQAYVTWDVTANQDANRVDLVFKAASGAYSDASRPTIGTLAGQGIPVYRYAAIETVGTAGQLTQGGSRSESIVLPSSLKSPQGKLMIEVDPSLAAGMTEGLTYLKEYPYECIEQTVSRFLPNVLSTRALKTAGLSDPTLEANLKSQVASDLQKLYNAQLADGGWGWWEGNQSDPQTTAYVALGLIEAKAAGYTVTQSVLETALGYLRGQLLYFTGLPPQYQLNRQAFLLYVLARGNEPAVSATVQLYEQRQSLSYYARAYLAQALYLIDPKDTRLGTLMSDLANSAILSATGAHWQESFQDYWNWNSDLRSTAIILDALIKINFGSDLNPNVVRWLMNSRTAGHWAGTQETAWSLMALTDWLATSGELKSNYDYAVNLNDRTLGKGKASPETIRQGQSLFANVADLLTGDANKLVIARSSGTGNLYYTAHLDISLPVEDTKALSRGITVSRSYYYSSDLKKPVTQAHQGDMLLARLTIIAPNDLHYPVIEDPLPAGLEAVDTSLKTSEQDMTPDLYDWTKFDEMGWGWWYFRHVELRDEKVVLSTDYLPAGTYVYTYYVRAGTNGEFRTIPPTAHEFYFPEVYGRGEGSIFTVTP